MATQCRGTKTKRINRHKLAVIQAYIIIGTLVLIGFIGGLVVGRATAPKKQVTVTETVEVPTKPIPSRLPKKLHISMYHFHTACRDTSTRCVRTKMFQCHSLSQ